MKKALPFLLFACIFGTIRAQQSEYFQRIDKVEKEIAEYTKTHLPGFEIPTEDLALMRKNAKLENISLSEDEFQKSLVAYKKYLLRVDFFNEYPNKRKLYAPPPS